MTSETPENRRLTVPDLEAIPVGNVVIDRIADSWVKIPPVRRGPWKWTNPGDPLDTIIATSEELIEDWGPVTAIHPAPLTEIVAKDADPQTGGMKEVKLSQLAAIDEKASVEVIHTDPTTGAQKGRKPVQIGAVDPKALMALGEVAGFGADKYATFNYLTGYPYSWSYDALQRHVNQFWAGEDLDVGEGGSGLPHLAHAAWHCLALLSYYLRDRGTDDRPHKILEKADQDKDLTATD